MRRLRLLEAKPMDTPPIMSPLPSATPSPRPFAGSGSLVAGAAPQISRRRELTPNATLVEREDLTPLIARYVARPDGAVPPFEPGQYFSLGLEIDGQFVLRPYSTASPRGATETLEFLVRRVPTGTFTPSLWQAAVGDRVWIGPPKGLFMLKPGDRRTHLLVSSGTGIAPFMSMLDDLLDSAIDAEVAPGGVAGLAAPAMAPGGFAGLAAPAAAPAGAVPSTTAAGPRVVVAHGVSYASELAYRHRIEARSAVDRRLTYVPTVSRPEAPENAHWMGRNGRVESILARVCGELRLEPLDTVAYLCGNPEMVALSREALQSLGLPADAVIHENYWTATGPPVA
jgi:ferredoxin--NADP+ reductase